ncbi:MAG: non-canonical purine NTP pyrophosphatase [Candidatus Harrisonbacteria bacterium]|nr:non-canonical purine NTP pyrophosphatase [Candidatus Harrisonbacteria bacterium]
MKYIVIATHNPGKILEYKAILKELPFKLLMLNDLNIDDEPEENGRTFEENAVKKAEFYSRFTDLPVLAEDSGLEIDCLNGEPGVFSRRWPGYKATDKELIDLALRKLRGVPAENRGAQFRVAVALKLSPQSKVVTAEGILRGRILETPSANMIPGFPFRSLFYVPALNKVLGDVTMEEEGLIGHRQTAIKNLLPLLIE